LSEGFFAGGGFWNDRTLLQQGRTDRRWGERKKATHETAEPPLVTLIPADTTRQLRNLGRPELVLVEPHERPLWLRGELLSFPDEGTVLRREDRLEGGLVVDAGEEGWVDLMSGQRVERVSSLFFLEGLVERR
jgi:hypothetical protein